MSGIFGDFRTEMPVAFYFEVKLVTGNSEIDKKYNDTSFMEVSGISSTITTKRYDDKGNSAYVYNLPTKITYTNLILKRGITTFNSNFSAWCKRNLVENTKLTIVTGDIELNLLNRFGYPQRSWSFENAYPVKWSVDAFNSKKNELAIEVIEICYSCMKRKM